MNEQQPASSSELPEPSVSSRRIARSVAPLRIMRRIHVRAALGNPCVSVYASLVLERPVPPMLGAEATWWRFARLRDRIEADASTLGPIRSVLGPVEAALTDPSGSLDVLDAALTTLGV